MESEIISLHEELSNLSFFPDETFECNFIFEFSEPFCGEQIERVIKSEGRIEINTTSNELVILTDNLGFDFEYVGNKLLTSYKKFSFTKISGWEEYETKEIKYLKIWLKSNDDTEIVSNSLNTPEKTQRNADFELKGVFKSSESIKTTSIQALKKEIYSLKEFFFSSDDFPSYIMFEFVIPFDDTIINNPFFGEGVLELNSGTNNDELMFSTEQFVCYFHFYSGKLMCKYSVITYSADKSVATWKDFSTAEIKSLSLWLKQNGAIKFIEKQSDSKLEITSSRVSDYELIDPFEHLRLKIIEFIKIEQNISIASDNKPTNSVIHLTFKNGSMISKDEMINLLKRDFLVTYLKDHGIIEIFIRSDETRMALYSLDLDSI